MFLRPRLAAAAALASVAALAVPGRPAAALLGANLLLATVVVLDVLRAPDPRGLLRARLHPPVASVGTEVEVVLLLSGASRRTAVEARDAAVPSLRPWPRRPAGEVSSGRTRLRYRLRPSRRGRFALGPLTLRTRGPLGLAGRQRTLGDRTELKVYPALRGREQVEGRIRRSRLLEVGTRSARMRGGGLEFDSLREYHPDDEFRRINWTATARAGKPISNLYREDRNQQVLLLLDAGRPMAGAVAGAPRFEHALDAAVAVASLGVSVGDRVGAFAFVDRTRAAVPPRSDGAQPGRIVDALFDVEPATVASDYRGAVGGVLSRYRRRALLVLFTDLADEAALDTLLQTIPVMVRRHLVVVVEVSDPEVDRLARMVPAAADDAFRKAAATSTGARRDLASRRLRRLGAQVVDRPPDALAPALADVYLRAKAYGLL